MTGPRSDVLVLGAGLTGAGVALELARRGIAVTLIDQDERAMNRASLRNEGKIHLGFIYANDTSRKTGLLQLEGALRFREIVEGWLGKPAEWMSLSTPFHYLVASDSIVAPEVLSIYYNVIGAAARNREYLGVTSPSMVRALTRAEIAEHFDPGRFSAGFATGERAIDTDLLAIAIRQAIDASPHVTFLPRRTVRSAKMNGSGYRIGGDGVDGPWELEAAQVVNATWERRSAIDTQLGLAAPDGLLHRLKYRLIARLPERLRDAPSVSMVLGRYGDIVIRPNGTAYLSWYPAGLRGWTNEVEPPLDWDAPCRGDVTANFAMEVASQILEAIDDFYPGIGASEPLCVDAGAIVAIGRSDVDKTHSGLHGRSRVGVVSNGGWHSVDPGKLTTAPMFAVEAANRVAAQREGRPK